MKYKKAYSMTIFDDYPGHYEEKRIAHKIKIKRDKLRKKRKKRKNQ